MTNTIWSRALIWQYLRAVWKHWYWVVGSGVLTALDIVERANADWYLAPRWLRLTGALICLLIAQYLAYAEIAAAHKELETEIAELKSGVEIRLVRVEAYENLNWSDSIYQKASHWVHIKFLLTIRNRNGREASAVELVTCDTDIPQATLTELIFLGDPDSPIENPVSWNRRIPEGDIRNVTVRVQFSLPMSEKATLTNGVSGVLRLADNRASAISVSFTGNVVASSSGQLPPIRT
jgi:hypothetical protein